MYNAKSSICLLLTSVFLFSFTQTIAQDRFEGKVTFKTDDDGKEQLMTYLVKGTKFRIEQSGEQGDGQGAMICDLATQKMTVLMNEQKMYMEMPMNDLKHSPKVNSEEPEFFAKSIEEKVILGHTCDKFEFKDKDKKGFAWMTKDIGPFLFMSNPKDMKSSQSSWQEEIMGAGYFPLLVKEVDSSGKIKTVFEVTELLAMKLDDNLFVPPPGFSKFSMPNMPNLMDMKKTK